jgi:hypothetical protein
MASSLSGFVSSVDYSEIKTPLKYDESPLILGKPSVVLKTMGR